MSTHLVSRRGLMQIVTSMGLSVFARPALAESTPGSSSHVVRTSEDEHGVTAILELEHAPFPAPGSWHHDSSVLVFVPRHHRPSSDEAVSFVVHFHGHNTTAERATMAHQLRD